MVMSLFTVEVKRQGPLELLLEPSFPVGYIGSLYRVKRMAAVPPPSSDLLVAVFIVVTALLPTSDCRLFRHDAVFILFFPPTALRRWLVADAFLCRCLFFSGFRSCAAISLLKLSLLLIYLGCIRYTFWSFLLELLTPACHSCKRMTTFDGLLLSSCPQVCSACSLSPPAFRCAARQTIFYICRARLLLLL